MKVSFNNITINKTFSDINNTLNYICIKTLFKCIIFSIIDRIIRLSFYIFFKTSDIFFTIIVNNFKVIFVLTDFSCFMKIYTLIVFNFIESLILIKINK